MLQRMQQPDPATMMAILQGEQLPGEETLAYLDSYCAAYPYCQFSQVLRAVAHRVAGTAAAATYEKMALIYVSDKQAYLTYLYRHEPRQGLSQKIRQQQLIIDRFLTEEPRITPRRDDLPEPQVVQKSLHDDSYLVSETLAKILLNQGNQQKALDIYEKLCLKYPEKSSYFAKKIQDLKKRQQ